MDTLVSVPTSSVPTSSGQNPPNSSGVPVEPLLMTEKEAAECLKISKRKLWELANRKVIASVKIDALKRYVLDDLKAWVKNRCPTNSTD